MERAKPRVLFLLTSSDWGGVQFFVLNLAKEAKKAGCTVLISAGGDGEMEKRSEESQLRYRSLKNLRREISPFHDLAALHELRLLIREFKPDVVHLNSSKVGVLGALAANLERVPFVIYRIGGWSFLENISWLKKQLYLIMEKWSAPNKDVIVTVHPGDEKVAKEKKIVPRQRLMMIPNGIDLETFDRDLLSKQEARKILGLAEDELVVGTLANFYPAKNLTEYLKTVAPLAKEKIRFVIIGDGPERENIERTYKDLNLGSQVILAGRHQNAAKLLSAFDIFVLPSDKEGMPWALLEAMAAGLPCIASDVGACSWMIGSANVVPAHDQIALQNSIKNLLQNEIQRITLGETMRQIVKNHFQWKESLKASLDLLTFSDRNQ